MQKPRFFAGRKFFQFLFQKKGVYEETIRSRLGCGSLRNRAALARLPRGNPIRPFDDNRRRRELRCARGSGNGPNRRHGQCLRGRQRGHSDDQFIVEQSERVRNGPRRRRLHREEKPRCPGRCGNRPPHLPGLLISIRPVRAAPAACDTHQGIRAPPRLSGVALSFCKTAACFSVSRGFLS